MTDHAVSTRLKMASPPKRRAGKPVESSRKIGLVSHGCCHALLEDRLGLGDRAGLLPDRFMTRGMAGRCQERQNLAPDGTLGAVVQRVVAGVRLDP